MRRRQVQGFTLIEILMFIVISSILMSVILLGANTALRHQPNTHQQWVALQVAKRCMEWFLDQKYLNGYGVLACPSTPSASACVAPSGYTVSTSIACTTWNGDSQYKTISVTVGGLASATLATQVGND